MANHPYVTFRGVEAHLDVQATFAHGTVPCQFQIRVPPADGIDLGGTLALHFGGTTIAFPDCKVDKVEALRNADGLMVWTLIVLDRRWKWKECGQVSGYYNVREGDNASALAGVPKQIKKGTEKDVRALMKICLDAMGETGYVLSKVPKDVFPEVEWDYKNPAQALFDLARAINFRIVLSLKNRVELWPEGEGQKLTKQGALDYQQTIDPPERPDSLIFVGQRKLWEQDLELEAVCRTMAGEYLPIDHPAISYKPSVRPIDGNYWWAIDPWFNAVNENPIVTINGIKTVRELAKYDVFRTYRIKTPFKLVTGETIDDVSRILPLLTSCLRVGKTTETNGVISVLPPVVWGVFTRDQASPEYFQEFSDPRTKIDSSGKPPSELTVEGGYNIDEKIGFVKFDRQVKQYGKKRGGVQLEGSIFTVDHPFYRPAKLFLRIGFGLRDAATRAWIFREVVRKSGQRKFGTKPRYVQNAEAIYKTISVKGQLRPTDKEYDQIAKHYLDAEERKYETRDPCAATYPGLLAIDLDGAIQQVTWSISERGATTHASRNREELVLGLSWAEQSHNQQLARLIASTPATARELEDKRTRRPA